MLNIERKTSETVKFDDREFVIEKMTPFKGLAVLKTILTRALPIDLLTGLADNETINKMLGGVSGSKKDMTEEEFIELQISLIKTVSEQLKGGLTPVIDDRGNFQVPNLENDMFLISWLLVKVVEVNYKDFFIELLQRAGVITEIPQDTAGALQQILNQE